jgi:hypothetical protein
MGRKKQKKRSRKDIRAEELRVAKSNVEIQREENNRLRAQVQQFQVEDAERRAEKRFEEMRALNQTPQCPHCLGGDLSRTFHQDLELAGAAQDGTRVVFRANVMRVKCRDCGADLPVEKSAGSTLARASIEQSPWGSLNFDWPLPPYKEYWA